MANVPPCMFVRSGGFSVAELIVAIGLLTVVAVVVIGLFVQLNASSSKTLDQSAALEVASRVLDEYAGVSPQEWLTASSREDLQTRNPRSQTTFYYQLSFRELSEPAGSRMGDLYRLDVEVSWWPDAPSRPNRRGYGRQRVHLQRSVFVESFR